MPQPDMYIVLTLLTVYGWWSYNDMSYTWTFITAQLNMSALVQLQGHISENYSYFILLFIVSPLSSSFHSSTLINSVSRGPDISIHQWSISFCLHLYSFVLKQACSVWLICERSCVNVYVCSDESMHFH